MNLDKLRKNYPKLIEYMKSAKMCTTTCNNTEKMIKDILSHKGEFSSYQEYYQKFIDEDGLNAKSANMKFAAHRTLLYRIWAFDEYDHFPDGFKFSKIVHPDIEYQNLNEFFKSIVDKIVKNEEINLLTKDTINRERKIAIHFFLNAQNQGADNFNNITPNMVTSFFIKDGKIIRGNSSASILKKLLRAFVEEFPILKILLNYIATRKDVVHLTELISDNEIKKAKNVLNSKNNEKISLRDKAVVAIALYTGMRGSDIANLTLDNIDWGNDRINISQSKTKQKLTLPLIPSLGNILYDYIVNERPKNTNSRKLFFNMKDQRKELKADNIAALTHTFMGKLCNKRYSSKGLRVLRHRLASKLLELGTEPAVISSILGHAEPRTLNKYIDLDIENLRSCALDVSIYPVAEEVYK